MDSVSDPRWHNIKSPRQQHTYRRNNTMQYKAERDWLDKQNQHLAQRIAQLEQQLQSHLPIPDEQHSDTATLEPSEQPTTSPQVARQDFSSTPNAASNTTFSPQTQNSIAMTRQRSFSNKE